MTDAATLCADPLWLPHKADYVRREIAFVRITPDRLAQTAFLADHQPQSDSEVASVSFDAVMAMQPETGPLHFLFHTAFCRSTLLVRAVNAAPRISGLSEPGIIASLAGGGAQAQSLIRPILDLLSRPIDGAEATFVKPTNHANMLMPLLLAARTDATAVLMSDSLPAFLRAVLRKGMLGRRWGRQLYLEMQSYAGLDLGMDAREQFAMTDLQAAGLAWFLARRWFALLLDGRIGGIAPERCRTLDGDAFNGARAETLDALGRWVGAQALVQAAPALAASDVFSRHAKLGGDFAAVEAAQTARTGDTVTEEEIAKVGEWIGLIAAQAGIQLGTGGSHALV